MKTLADMKRDIVGKTLVLKERFHKPCDEAKVVKAVRSKDIVMIKPDGRDSHLTIPCANLVEYDGTTIKVYEAGTRDLTPTEQAIIDGEPKDEKQDEIDMLSDGSTMFWRRKIYYKEKNAEYLYVKTDGSKRITRSSGTQKIVDDAVKGELSLVYEVIQ